MRTSLLRSEQPSLGRFSGLLQKNKELFSKEMLFKLEQIVVRKDKFHTFFAQLSLLVVIARGFCITEVA
jgi:hypothetical protein